MAELADIYVNEAFAASHRAHASVEGITRFVPVCAAGYQLQKEIEYFKKVMDNPQRPLAIIVGGAKVSTKLGLLENLIPKIDYLIIGGAMANTFLKAQGKEVGKSLVENDYIETAAKLLESANKRGVKVFLPVDAVVSADAESRGDARQVSIDKVPDGHSDSGHWHTVRSGLSSRSFKTARQSSGTVRWVFSRRPRLTKALSLWPNSWARSARSQLSAAAIRPPPSRQADAENKVVISRPGAALFWSCWRGKISPASRPWRGAEPRQEENQPHVGTKRRLDPISHGETRNEPEQKTSHRRQLENVQDHGAKPSLLLNRSRRKPAPAMTAK